MSLVAKTLKNRCHYSGVVLAVVFLVLLVSAGTRATPGVLMLPWVRDYGWSRATISLAIAVNIALYGMIGPFAAAAIQRYGVRNSVMSALGLLAASAGLSTFMTATWQMILLWGIAIGSGTGLVTLPLGAIIVNRWFVKHRGLAMGIFSASTATGQLVFLPLMASIITRYDWQPVVWLVAGVAALAIPLVALLVPEQPGQVGLRPYGQPEDAPVPAIVPQQNLMAASFGALRLAVRNRDFWLLAFSFFVCGASTNGFIGSHWIAICGDHGLTEVHSASILAAMGICDLIGTTLSGWLSDRYNNRVLLFWYYGLRGLALLYLPYAFDAKLFGLPLFAVLYGLDWVATVPPTLRLLSDIFGKATAPVIFAWTLAAHQVGASFAALGAGVLRTSLGNYNLAIMISGGLCILSAMAVLRIRKANPRNQPAVTAS